MSAPSAILSATELPSALVVTPSTNLAYATWLSMGRSERLTALFLLSDGPAVLVTPAFEESNVTRGATVDDVRTRQEDQDRIALAARLLIGKRRPKTFFAAFQEIFRS
jgi:hypothetical protein